MSNASKKTRDAIKAILAASAAKMKAAPITEKFEQYRDTFDRDHARVTVELTHSKWSTFARMYAGISDPSWREHESREAAREFARAWLARICAD